MIHGIGSRSCTATSRGGFEALAAAVVVAVLASAATTWMIGQIQPAEALRSE
jgi:hypothetical protein